jgi:glycosyltransferase involved in cell wall biosynthesis
VDAKTLKPRILLFSKLFWPEGGGGELATYLIARSILSKHFDVTIVSGTRRPEPDVLRAARYVHWSILESKLKPVEWFKLVANTKHIRSLIEGADLVYITSHTLIPLAIIAKTLKPSVKVVLHAHNYQLLTFTSVILAGRGQDVATDIMVEYGEHGSLLRAILAGLGHYVNIVNRTALNYVDKGICVSRRQCEILVEHIPELKGRTTVIYNPPPPLPGIGKNLDEEPALLYVGGGSYIKGYYLALKTLTRIAARLKCRIYMIHVKEVGNAEGMVERISQTLNGRLIPLDRMPHKEYLGLLRRAWGLLLPSIAEEPLPYAVVESMLLGTIPVASRVGGVPEIVEGTPAEEYTFTPGDAGELLDRVEKLISQPRDAIVDAGMKLREHALRLLNEREIESKLLNLFRSVMSRCDGK